MQTSEERVYRGKDLPKSQVRIKVQNKRLKEEEKIKVEKVKTVKMIRDEREGDCI